MEQKKIIGKLALAVPFAAMLVMIAVNALNLSHAEYRVKITGYDPRDLLRGHYLIFRYDWPEDSKPSADACWESGGGCCACFNGASEAPAISFENCAAVTMQKDMCRGTLAMADNTAGSPQPHENLRQYYIPEADAPYLETALRGDEHEFEVGVVPLPDGEGTQLKMLYIDGQPLEKFLKSLPRSEPPEEPAVPPEEPAPAPEPVAAEPAAAPVSHPSDVPAGELRRIQ